MYLYRTDRRCGQATSTKAHQALPARGGRGQEEKISPRCVHLACCHPLPQRGAPQGCTPPLPSAGLPPSTPRHTHPHSSHDTPPPPRPHTRNIFHNPGGLRTPPPATQPLKSHMPCTPHASPRLTMLSNARVWPQGLYASGSGPVSLATLAASLLSLRAAIGSCCLSGGVCTWAELWVDRSFGLAWGSAAYILRPVVCEGGCWSVWASRWR